VGWRDDLLSDPLLVDVPIHGEHKLLGGVLLERRLGQGGMGSVYKGRHQRLGIDVAVKVMRPPEGEVAGGTETFVRRFTREAQMAASVTHQNLVRVMDVNYEHGLHYLVMDYVDGESVGERLKRLGTFTESDCAGIALGAAEGLAEAHARHIVHRDIKPDNIMLDTQGRVRITDLGIAKALTTMSGEHDEARLTASYMALGTPFYMAPEQFISAHDVGPTADVWSLGVTLYQLLTGELPWYADNALVLLSEIESKPLPSLKERRPNVSDGMCAIIARALEKRPEKRFADCGKMADALAEYLRPQPAGQTRGGGAYIPIEPLVSESDEPIRDAVVGPDPPIVPDGNQRGTFEPPFPGPIARRVEAERRHQSSRDSASAPERNWPWVAVTLGVLVAMAVAIALGSEYLKHLARPAGLDGPQRTVPEAGAAHTVAPTSSGEEDMLLPSLEPLPDEVLDLGERRGAPGEPSAEISVAGAPEGARDDFRIEYLEWMAKGMALRRAGRTEEAIAAFTSAQSFAPPGSAKPSEAIQACRHDDCLREADDAKRRNDWAGAVAAYDKALGYLDEQSTRVARAAASDTLQHERSMQRALQHISRREWTQAEAVLVAILLQRPGDERARSLLLDVKRFLPAEADLIVQLDNGVELDAAYVKPGRFLMGHDPREDAGGTLSHEVRMRSGYYLSRTEVTVRQFAAFERATSHRTLAEAHGYSSVLRDDGTWARDRGKTWRDTGFAQGEDHPVVCVSWLDASAFCRFVSRKTRMRCRLPTEAEWEYACRAGAATAYSWGNDANNAHEYCNAAGHRMVQRRGRAGDSYANTSAVGSFPPNAWGFSDMHGNVWEWCADWYAPAHTVTRLGTDAGGPAQGTERVIRGGAWNVSAMKECTASFRGHAKPTFRSTCIGFRVLLERQ
jgi:formylglycine-generating enzyme required for sulfatase activity/serine/threonine protein kinase